MQPIIPWYPVPRSFRPFVAQAGRSCLAAFTLLLGCQVAATHAADPAADRLQFNRDIRPILSDKCFVCHGPDSASRKADLRLDQREQAVAERDGGAAIVPGQAAKSEVVRRITARDEDEHMPPAKSGLRLSGQEVELLIRWINEGAEYQPHWSFLRPARPAVPAAAQASEAGDASNPIDRFLRARLAAEGLRPSPEADKPTLIRRATFDLTGLPPTPAEIDAFLADASPDAYEQLVDRLLASPRYGERMASQWLDAARYADTNGYQSDEQRFMWRWRDWVIAAFNHNMPFDQFTVEQLAGDLLPSPTLDQRIATGFNRNHRANSEGGIIAEEFLVEYAVDRLDATATVWLGLTIGCARCHDHKYDPITQRDFYSLLAFFNNVPEVGKVSRTGNSVPMIKAPTPDLAAEAERLDGALAAAQQEWQTLASRAASAQAEWEASVAGDEEPVKIEGLTTHFPLDGSARDALGKQTEGKFVDGEPAFAPGQIGQAAQLAGDRFIDVGDLAPLVESARFSYGAWVLPKSNAAMAVLSRMDAENSYVGYDLFLQGGRVQADLVNRLLDDSIRVETRERIKPNAWHHLLVTYDGSRSASGVRIYVDGELQKLKVISDTLSNAIKTSEPLRIGSRATENRFQGLIDDVRIYDRELTAEEAATLASTESVAEIVKTPPAQRTPAQAQKVQSLFLKEHAPPDIRQPLARLEKARQERAELDKRIPTTMVMQEKPQRGDTFLLIRGQYDKPGEQVQPGVPASLPPLASGARPDRLGLARWLVDPANPLTARVTVNRYWQLFFGTGLVKTSEDFGSQGELPRNQELLDWLATEFIATGWDVQRMHKLMVTSAAYRQTSKLTPELLARDPENRLLARGPRQRLSAEMIRDAALASSGLLVEKVGGPSVKPYQPPGLWEELGATAGKYSADAGESLYRRSLYTFWKRTIPPPSMMIFDAAGRETCCVRQAHTNTPLQALTLLNDVTYVEAARKLAERLLLCGGASAEERIRLGFRLVTAREPQPRELAVLRASLERHLARYQADCEAAARLIAVGESPRNPQLAPAELAAYTVLASVLLNLDEAITKE